MKRIKSFSLVLAFIMAFTVLFAFPQTAEAAAVKTNVVTQLKSKSYSGTGYYIQQFTYNSKGLLTKKVEKEGGSVQLTVTYKYNSDNLVKRIVAEDSFNKITVTNTYNAKKQLTKRVSKSSIEGSTTTVKYTYNSKGRLTKAVTTVSGGYADGEKTTETFTFNSSGILTKRVRSGSYGKQTNTYTYDKYGFIKKDAFSGETITRKSTYSNGVLTKYQDTATYDGGSDKDKLRTVTTKQISVTKALSAIVKEQQREIINGTHGTNLYLGYNY